MRHTIFGDVMTRLKELRRERGYTQIKMQMLTGIDQSDYSKLETGKRYYTYEQLRRIALALDTSMDYLAGLTDVPTCRDCLQKRERKFHFPLAYTIGAML